MPPVGTYRSGGMVIISGERTEYTYAFVSIRPSRKGKKHLGAGFGLLPDDTFEENTLYAIDFRTKK